MVGRSIFSMSEGALAGLAGADAVELAAQDLVDAVGEHDGDDVEAFARLGPQRLDACTSRCRRRPCRSPCGRDRRSPHRSRPASRSRSSRPCSGSSRAARPPPSAGKKPRPVVIGFVDHDGVFGNRHRDRLRDRGMVQRAGRLDQFDQRLRLGILPAWRRAQPPAPPGRPPNSRRPRSCDAPRSPPASACSACSDRRRTPRGRWPRPARCAGSLSGSAAPVRSRKGCGRSRSGPRRAPSSGYRSGPSPCSRSCRRSAPPAPAHARSARCRSPAAASPRRRCAAPWRRGRRPAAE